MFDKLVCSLFGSKKVKERIVKLRQLERDFEESQNKIMNLVDKMVAEQALITSLFNAVPDWLWHKDENGVYVRANKKIRDELFCGLPESEVIGFNDVQIAKKIRDEYGAENHTFGELCAGSDDIVADCKIPMTFNEWGLVKGKMLRVVVHKNVIRDACGKLIGTVGAGYNITDDYDKIKEIESYTKDKETARQLKEFRDKDKFELNSSKDVTCKCKKNHKCKGDCDE